MREKGENYVTLAGKMGLKKAGMRYFLEPKRTPKIESLMEILDVLGIKVELVLTKK